MTERPQSPPEDDATSKDGVGQAHLSSGDSVQACCAVGSRKDVAAIDEAIRAGESHRKLARRFPRLSREDVKAHAPHLRAVPPPEQGQAAAPAEVSIARARDDLGEYLSDCPPDRESRVRAIMLLQASGRWETGATGPVLAEVWGVTDSAMGSYAAEASRRVKASTDPEFVRSRLATALDEAVDHARGKPRDVAEVAKAFMPLVGLGGAQLSVKVVMEHPMLAGLFAAIRGALEPYPEAMAAVERALVELEEKRRGGAITVPALEG